MNLPISATTTAVSGIAKSLVKNVADGLGKALDFDAILRGDGVAPVERRTDPQSMRTESADLIRDALSAIGVGANPALRIDVKSDGQPRLAGDHPRAAEIELHLNSDVEVRGALNRLAAAVGQTQITVGPA